MKACERENERERRKDRMRVKEKERQNESTVKYSAISAYPEATFEYK